MSDKKTADKEILLKHTNEEDDELSTLQEEFDALLPEEGHRPSITEIDGKLSTLHASDFAVNAPSAAELAKHIEAKFGDHTIIIVGDHTVINEEAENDKTVNMSEDHPSKPKADLKKPAQNMMEADALEQRKPPVFESNSTVIKPRAFAREISPAEIAAFKATENRKLKGAEINDPPDNNSEGTHAAKETSPLNDSELFSSMQNDLDALEHEEPAAENFPEWEPIPTEPPTDTSTDSLAEQTIETASEETPSPHQASASDISGDESASAEDITEWESMPTEPLTDTSADSLAEETPSPHQASASDISENEIVNAEDITEWEPMPTVTSADNLAEQTTETASEETPSPPQASKSEVSEHEMAREKNAASKIARFTKPLIVMCQKARTLYSRHPVENIFHKRPESEPKPAEPPAAVSSDIMAEEASEAAPEEAPSLQSSKEMWGSIIFIVFSLATMYLVLWQIVGSFNSDVKVTTHTPGNIQSPQPTTQRQAVTAEQPAQISKKQVSDISKAEIKPLASADSNTAEVLKPETVPPAKQAVKPTVAAVIKEEQAVPALASKPPAAPTAKPAKAAPAISDAASGDENWAVALSSVDSEKTVIQQLARLRATGIEAEYIRTIKNGKAWFFIQIGGFSNKQEAKKQGGITAKNLNTQVSWIKQPKNNP